MLHHSCFLNLVQSLSRGLGEVTLAHLRTLRPDPLHRVLQEVSQGNVRVSEPCCQFWWISFDRVTVGCIQVPPNWWIQFKEPQHFGGIIQPGKTDNQIPLSRVKLLPNLEYVQLRTSSLCSRTQGQGFPDIRKVLIPDLVIGDIVISLLSLTSRSSRLVRREICRDDTEVLLTRSSVTLLRSQSSSSPTLSRSRSLIDSPPST